MSLAVIWSLWTGGKSQVQADRDGAQVGYRDQVRPAEDFTFSESKSTRRAAVELRVSNRCKEIVVGARSRASIVDGCCSILTCPSSLELRIGGRRGLSPLVLVPGADAKSRLSLKLQVVIDTDCCCSMQRAHLRS